MSYTGFVFPATTRVLCFCPAQWQTTYGLHPPSSSRRPSARWTVKDASMTSVLGAAWKATAAEASSAASGLLGCAYIVNDGKDATSCSGSCGGVCSSMEEYPS